MATALPSESASTSIDVVAVTKLLPLPSGDVSFMVISGGTGVGDGFCVSACF